MRTRAGVLAVVGLLVGLVGCGSDAASPTTTAVDLNDRMLTVADVGTGWKLSNPVNDDDLAGAAQLPCEGRTVDPAVAERLRGVTGVQFEPVDGAYRHLIEIVLVGEPARLAADIDILDEAMRACPAGVPGGLDRMDALALPALGDQRVGLHYAATEGPGAVWDIRAATVRVGGRAVHVGLVEILATPDAEPFVSGDAFEALVTTAVARLGG